ncbi:MAG: cyclic nucleotide-binding domain-containing protein [Candidatus Firestonebacteria bacterium]|nr:cyclic nucleotide-binding domain-containing protein [Candidatus Firestonebacteria bacterium]
MIRSILKTNSLFTHFSDAELTDFLQLCERQAVSKGGVVFSENAEDDGAVYFIEAGIIKIIKRAQDQRQVLAMFGLGNVFGEMSFLNPGPRSATATADEDVIVHKLLPTRLSELEQQSPGTAIKLYKVFILKLVARLRQTDDALMKKSREVGIIVT